MAYLSSDAFFLDSDREYKKTDNWINVKDRLPVEHANVLLHVKGLVNSVSYGFMNKSKKFEVFFTNGAMQDDGVTHWMPLPEPPK